MGGNIFGTTRRYQADEYFKLVNEVCDVFAHTDAQWNQFEIIPAYREKESFGDMDILYSTTDDIPLCAKHFGLMFDTDQVSRNSNVTSVAYKEFQIDFIHMGQENFNYSLAYHSWNDLGNLTGKLARYFGLKHGHAGLVLPMRDGDNKFDEILLTLEHDKFLEFVGLDSDVFNSGFDNLQQIFEYVATSPYYNPEWYKLENISSVGRIRDRKRDTYRKFLEFNKTQTGVYPDRIVDKSDALERIFDFFPEALPEFAAKMGELALLKLAKEKFNGDLVSEITGFTDKDLGSFMKHLRKDFYFKPEVVAYLSDEKIQELVMSHFKKF
jgi:hypothetical protein